MLRIAWLNHAFQKLSRTKAQTSPFPCLLKGYSINVNYSLHLNDPSQASIHWRIMLYDNTWVNILYSLSSPCRLKHTPSIPQMLSQSLWLKISSLAFCLGVATNVLSTSVQELYSFVLYLEGSFTVQYALNCFKSRHSKTMVQMICQQDKQMTTCRA